MRVGAGKMAASLLIVVSYAVSGKAALLLALPPGYASAIFPPAGIAVAVAFVLGRQALPSVFLGSLLLNLWVAYSSSSQIDASGLDAAFIIAAASMLQAAAGGWLLRRTIGYPASFDKAGEISHLLLFAPAICLVSSSLSVGGLALLGIFDKGSVLANWLSWWIGDTLGVLVMFPVVMTLAGEPRELWRRRMKTVALPMLLILALFVAMFLKANQWERQESLVDYEHISQQSLDQIKMGLAEQSALLIQLQGLFIHDANGKVTRLEFQRFCRGTLANYPMIQALEWAPRVADSDRDRFEAAQRKEIPGFRITERDEAGVLRPAGRRDWYYPLSYVEPLSGNETALGFDLGSNQKRRQAIDNATASGLPGATVPIRLVQGGAGILIIQPVKMGGDLDGVVLSALRVHDFINKVLPSASRDLRIRLIDGDAQSVIYDSFAGSPIQAISDRTFDFGGRHYRLQTVPTERYYMLHRGWQSWGVLALGAFGTSLLGALLLLGTGYTARVEAQVRERTNELRESEERFRNTLENSPIGMGIGGLHGEFLQINQAYCAIVGYSKDELANMTVDALTYAEDLQLDAANKRRLLNGDIETYRMEKRYVRKDGRIVWVQVTVSLEKTLQGAPEHFIVQVEDITERKNAAELLRKSAEEYKDLYDNAPCGYHSIDRNGKYVLINNTELEWLGRRREEVVGRMGCVDFLTPESKQVLERSFAELREKGRVEGIELDVVCKGGDIKHVMASATAVYDASGEFLMSRSVLTDVTAQKQMERMIRDKVLELQTILDGSSVAITFVRDRRQVWTNRRMSELFGYTLEEMANQSTRMFYRSQQDYDDFGATAYPVLLGGEVFGAELEMRHRDGHPIWINISGKAIYPADMTMGSIWVLEDITERKHAEAALTESRELLALFIENAPAALAMFDREMCYLSASRRWRTDYGLGEQDLIGRSHYEIFPEVPERWKALHQRGMGGEILREAEDRFEREDGSVMWLQWEIWPWRKADGSVGGIILVTEDITERKRVQDALRDSAREIEDLYNNAPCGYHSLDQDGIIVRVNDTELQWLGYRREEMVGKKIADFMVDSSKQRLREKFGDFKKRGWVSDLEFELVRRDGSVLPILLNGTAIYDTRGEFMMSRSTIFDLTERKKLERRLEEQAHTDSLTGLNNRRHFYELAEHELALARRLSSPLALMLMDIDHFKQVNDTYGHDVGDAVLKAMSRGCLQTLREIDIVARLGGEEFVVMLPGVNGSQAVEAAERLRIALANLDVQISVGKPIKFSVSIGVTSLQVRDDNVDLLIKRADTALYAAKHGGRNRVHTEGLL